jgi:hypothetical protein
VRLAALALAAALLAPAATLGADAPKKGEVPAVVLARFVLPEETWGRMQAATAAQLQQYIEAALRQSGTKLPADFAARFSAAFATLFSYQEVIDLQAGVLAKHYSDAEIKELLAFYRTPLGQKLIRTMPEVSQDVNGQVLAVIQRRMPDLIERMKDELDDAAPAK